MPERGGALLRPDANHRLIQLRWVAVLGVCTVLVATGPMLGLVKAHWPPYAIVALLALWNGVLHWRKQQGLSAQSAGSQLALDLLLLSAMLAWTGGLQNPFAIFLVVQVVLAAILAPTLALPVGSLAALLLLLLAGLGANGVLPEGGGVAQDGSMQWGLALALLMTSAVAVPFSMRIMGDLREREREAAQYHAEADRERQRLEAAVTAVGAGLLMTDSRGVVHWNNAQANAVFAGLTPGRRLTLEGSPWPTDDALRARRPLELRLERRSNDGLPRHYALGARFVTSEDGLTQMVVVATDVTARRAAELQLASTEKLAALGRLAAGMAHEINTPLGSVRLLAEECSEEIEKGGHATCAHLSDCATRLTEIRGETERISGLVRRFLDLAHPGSARTEDVDISGLVSEAIRLVSLRDPALRRRIEERTEGSVPLLHTARDQLLQVLLNGLDNAVDATRLGAGAICVTTAVREGLLTIDIEDQGHGVPRELMPHIFEPFFTTKLQGEGTGLGLFVSFEIVQNLGGRLTLEPRAQGACLHIEFPLPR